MVAESRMVDAEHSLTPLIQLDRLGLRLGQRLDRKGKVLSPGTPIFSEVSLEIRSGETIGLVGSAGSGKTSLLRLLNRLIEPTQGKLFYQGQPYHHLPVAQLRRDILPTAQEPKLLQPTGLAAIVYGLQLKQIEIQPRLDNWVSRMELSETLLSKPEVELSPGQRQWISLSRALALEPPVLLLDEPTATLDPRQRDHLKHILQQMSDTTLIIASQDLDWLQALVSKTWLIRDRGIISTADWPAINAQIHASKPSPDEDWD
jgi:D-methionine transport system ATP-binding protein